MRSHEIDTQRADLATLGRNAATENDRRSRAPVGCALSFRSSRRVFRIVLWQVLRPNAVSRRDMGQLSPRARPIRGRTTSLDT